VQSVRSGSAWTVPIKGLTLVQLWWFSQFVFAAAMAATWFVSTVYGAYLVIAVTGFCWALCQWAPYSLLGELILLDGTGDRSQNQLSILHTRPSSDSRRSISQHGSSSPRPPLVIPPADESSSRSSTPFQSAVGSRTSLPLEQEKEKHESDQSLNPDDSFTSQDRSSGGNDLTPLVIQTEHIPEQMRSTVVLRHSDELSDEDMQNLSFGHESPVPPHGHTGTTSGDKGTADKAGVILGIHNVFLVLPQFIVTFMASIIFYLMEPDQGLPAKHPNSPPVDMGNGTVSVIDSDMGEVMRLVVRDALDANVSSPDAVGLIFRIGGLSAAIGGWITVRLARRWARGQGV